MEEEGKKEEMIRPKGEIVRFVRIRRGTADFAEGGNLAFNVRLPRLQLETLEKATEEVASARLEDKPFFWIYRTRRDELSPWFAVVIAGSFQEEREKAIDLFDEEQKNQWFNQLLGLLDKDPREINEINHQNEFSLKLKDGKEIDFDTIWKTLNQEPKK